MMMHDNDGGDGLEMISITVSFAETLILIVTIIQPNSTNSVDSINLEAQ